MDAQTAIINTALAQLGQSPVLDLTAPSLSGSDAAYQLTGNLSASYQAVLRRHGWLSALSYAVLNAATPAGYTAPWKYAGVFTLPSNCLRVWDVCVPGLDFPFPGVDLGSFGLLGAPIASSRWETNTTDNVDGASTMVLLADTTDTLQISFVRTVNYSALDAHLADAIAFDCAARTAWSVTGDRGVARDLAQAAEAKVMLAISVDATQEAGQASLAPSIPARLRALARG